MTTRAVLHIGTKKTGTTYIQEFLRSNIDVLEQAGWSYPSFLNSRNHLGIPLPFSTYQTSDIHRAQKITTPEKAQARIVEIGQHLAENVKPGQQWIFTSEFFSSRLKFEGEVAALRDFLGHYFDEIRIVVYLRRPEFMIASCYSQSIKEGSYVPLDWEYVINRPNDYSQVSMLKRWQLAFGADNVTVRPYFEWYRHDAQAMLNDFFASVGIPHDAPWREPERRADNRSLRAEGVQVLRAINFSFPQPGVYQRTLVHQRAAVSRRVQATTGGAPIGLTAELSETALREFANANNTIVSMFGGEQWQEWREQEMPPPADAITMTITNARLAEVVYGLVDENEKIEPGFVAQLIARMSVPVGIVNWNKPDASPDIDGFRRKIRHARGRVESTAVRIRNGGKSRKLQPDW